MERVNDAQLQQNPQNGPNGGPPLPPSTTTRAVAAEPWELLFGPGESPQIPINNDAQLQGANRTLEIDKWQYGAEWGWHALLLREMGQATVNINFEETKFYTIRDQTNQDVYPNIEAVKKEIVPYTCPSGEMPENRPQGLGYTNYRGNIGYWPESLDSQSNANGNNNNNGGLGNNPLNQQQRGRYGDRNGLFVGNGIFYGNSEVGFRDVRDGETETLMFGETLFGFWGDSNSCCARPRENEELFDEPIPGPIPQGASTPYYNLSWGSWHPELINFVFVDAHAEPLSKNIDREIFYSLSTRGNGEQIPDF